MYIDIDKNGGVTSVTGADGKYALPRNVLDDTDWNQLNKIEKNCLEEAAICLRSKAYTGAQFMSLKALESLCRRYYKKTTKNDYTGKNWFDILDALRNDPDIKSCWDLLDYLRDGRNEVGRPDKTSTEFDAENSYRWCLRLTTKLLKVVS
jgi:hypothetical protein